MTVRALLAFLLCMGGSLHAETQYPASAAARRLKFSTELLPSIIDQVGMVAIAGADGRHMPRYATIGLDQDEYVYSLTDKIFIRTMKGRYELPSWRLCGDWASVRVEIFDESMNAIGPATVWFLAYRDGRWVRVVRDESGFFVRNEHPVDLPPYAVRCFNLDR